LPQAASVVPGWHPLCASQHPDAQVAGPHWTEPQSWPTHCSGILQIAQAWPPLPHWIAVVPGTQSPFAQHPDGQVIGSQLPLGAFLHFPAEQI
jgi:hypothetical protein